MFTREEIARVLGQFCVVVVLKVRGLLLLSIKVFVMLFYADAFFSIKL